MTISVDIQPILSERCAHCHGVDEATREGGLRLDLRQSALRGGDSGEPAIVPGKPNDSELLRRLTSEDAGEVMPPPDDHARLSETQVEKLRQWIQAGRRLRSPLVSCSSRESRVAGGR